MSYATSCRPGSYRSVGNLCDFVFLCLMLQYCSRGFRLHFSEGGAITNSETAETERDKGIEVNLCNFFDKDHIDHNSWTQEDAIIML